MSISSFDKHFCGIESTFCGPCSGLGGSFGWYRAGSCHSRGILDARSACLRRAMLDQGASRDIVVIGLPEIQEVSVKAPDFTSSKRCCADAVRSLNLGREVPAWHQILQQIICKVYTIMHIHTNFGEFTRA